MRKTFITYLAGVLACVSIISCTTTQVVTTIPPPPAPKVINLDLTASPTPNAYVNLDYGIRINLKDVRSAVNHNILLKHDGYVTTKPDVKVYPDVTSFVKESLRRYMRTMGFRLDSDISSDYMMSLSLQTFNVSWLDGIGWSAEVRIDVAVFDHDNRQVFPTVNVSGRSSSRGSGNDYVTASNVMNQAYANALADIDWDRIAYLLHRSSSPSSEKDKAVRGDGNTALEHLTVIFNVTAEQKGAMIYYEIVSSTPEVKSSARNYIDHTPFYGEQTFDIMGLTYNNAGNVSIRIICEKDGYYSQSHEHKISTMIDQKRIHDHFNLEKKDE